MKTIIIKNSTLAVLLLASSMVGAETQYPAADFQPKVVYTDPDYKPSSQPSVQSAAPSSTDSQYPASNFQPKVLYTDPNYKSTASSTSSAGAAQQSAAERTASESEPATKEESGSYFIGLIVLAVVGFILFRRGAKEEGKERKAGAGYQVTTGSSTTLTGVAKYINRASGTGVARYLERQASASASAAVTGVAKYMARKTESSKTSEAATGVAKYLRDRG